MAAQQHSTPWSTEEVKLLVVDLYQKHDAMWKVDHPNYKKRVLRAKALKSIVAKLPGRSKCHFSIHCELPSTGYVRVPLTQNINPIHWKRASCKNARYVNRRETETNWFQARCGFNQPVHSVSSFVLWLTISPVVSFYEARNVCSLCKFTKMTKQIKHRTSQN